MYTILANIPDQVPDSWYEVLLLPFFFTAVGVIIWVTSRTNEIKSSKPAPWKWSAILPFLIALYSGWGPLMWMRDPIYASRIADMGKKPAIAHYSAFFVPVVALIGLVIWHFVDQRQERF